MNLLLLKSKLCKQKPEIYIQGSKSETNRMLILQALYPDIAIINDSNADDCMVMKKALATDFSALQTTEIDIHHAGTAMRFLTAFFAQKQGSSIILTGSSRMKERPISILVDALQALGADIEYTENKGFPPLKITGKKLNLNKVSLPATISSQYISALLLIAPTLENGLEIELIGEVISIPYIKMTLSLLNQIGVETSFENNIISIKNLKSATSNLQTIIESDWSSASYYYSIIALSEIGSEIKLSSFKQNSLQGDAVLVDIYKDFGVETFFEQDSIILRKSAICNLQSVIYNLQSCPDLAQTIAVTCFGLQIGCELTGLQTLKIKETDRLLALKTELEKLGGKVSITDDTLTFNSISTLTSTLTSISTYNDHRMAMAFAPLAIKFPIIIIDAEVVTKSYPDFWDDLRKIGFGLENTL